jgi:Short repeat of unknown function (DUF308)
MMLVAGAAEVINAFQVKSWGKFLLWLLLGVLYIVAGFVTFENPLLAAAFLTLLLGFSLIASEIMRIVLGFSMKQGTPWLWVPFSGAITPSARPRDSRPLAGLRPLHSGTLPWHRSHLCGDELDRRRARFEKSGGVTVTMPSSASSALSLSEARPPCVGSI